MSKIARWSYRCKAIIKPFVSYDAMTQEIKYGPEYEIACNWKGGPVQARSNIGDEYVGSYEVYHEDPRTKYLDVVVSINGFPVNAEVRTHLVKPVDALRDPVPDFLMVLA